MRMDLSAEGNNRQIQAWASHVAFWHLSDMLILTANVGYEG